MQDNGLNEKTRFFKPPQENHASQNGGAQGYGYDEGTTKNGDGRPHSQSVPMFMNRYRVIKELGRGGMGMVYHCFDEVGKIEVALKTLPPELSHNQTEMEDVRDNFQIVHKLSHSNIAAVHQIEKDPATGDCYIIMEYVNGKELRSWMRERRKDARTIPLPDALPVLRQLAAALDYAHGKNVIHRDIKPANIMLTMENEVKLLDFGLAAQLHSSLSSVSMAVTGRAGTAAYMSPEQMSGKRQKATADQYALAVVAYEMLSGYRPFDCPDFEMLKSAVLNDAPEPVKGLPAHVWEALKKALAKKPEDRFGSCKEFVDALEGKKPVSRPRGNRNLLIGAAVLMAAVLAFWGASALKTPDKAGADTGTEVKTPEPPVSVTPPPEPPVSVTPPPEPPVSVTPPPEPQVDDSQLMQEVYILQASLEAFHAQLSKSPLDEGQTFGDHKRTFTKNYTSAQKVMNETANPKRFVLAHKWYLSAQTEAKWLTENTPKRETARRLLAEAEAARDKADKDGAATLGKMKFDAASDSLQQAKTDFEAASFDRTQTLATSAATAFQEAGKQAVRSRVASYLTAARMALGANQWNDAATQAQSALALDPECEEAKKLKTDADTGAKAEKLEAALTQARTSKTAADWEGVKKHATEALAIDSNNAEAKQLVTDAENGLKAAKLEAALAQARTSKTAADWDGVKKHAAEALALEPGNEEARKLNSEAEANLRTMVKIYAQCDGQPVSATIDQFSPNHSGRTADGAFLLEKGKSYDLHLTYQKDGNTYVGSLAFTADWNGHQQKTVALKNSFTGIITLPGNIVLELVKIRAGSFQMGSPESEEYHRNDETLHGVTLTRDYWLGKYEVTQEQYEAVMKTNPSYFKKGGRYPVEMVKWDDAVKFCGELNRLMKGKLPPGYEFNLPTEAQWEYAARGGNKSRHYVYSGSNDCGSVAWYYDNSGSSTHPVGQKQTNELGLYDMSGNVWEWCRDQCEYEGGVVTDTYKDNIKDPLCTTGTFRVFRGGSWDDRARYCRSAIRNYGEPSFCLNYLGFRLALVPVP